MKNFPHQVNDLTKLTAALGVAQTLIAGGQGYSDDRVFGEALAYAQVYTFRNRDLSVAENLAAESTKQLGDQGFRTAARDLRRLLFLAGLIGPGPTLTARGNEILNATAHVALRNALWREAMLQLPLADAAGNVSHPYRILLRLVADFPGIPTIKLLLALEAKDDSAAEYARIRALANEDFPTILGHIHVGPANARNAVKIIPGIAEQVGDIRRHGGRAYLAGASTATEDLIIDDAAAPEYERSVPSDPVPIAADAIAPIPNFRPLENVPVDLSAAHALRQRRTIQHQRTTLAIAQVVAAAGYTTYANPYDCLGHKPANGSLLIEVKTLDGTRSDERRQAERALGQLRGYRYYNVPATMKNPRLVEVVAFSERPTTDAVQFLRESACICAWNETDHWRVADLDGAETPFAPDALLA